MISMMKNMQNFVKIEPLYLALNANFYDIISAFINNFGLELLFFIRVCIMGFLYSGS